MEKGQNLTTVSLVWWWSACGSSTWLDV